MKSLIVVASLLLFGIHATSAQSATTTTTRCTPFSCSRGRVFDSNLCWCVCDPAINCTAINSRYVKNPTTCACECSNAGTTVCTERQRFDNTTCSCLCKGNCLGCLPPQIWSSSSCSCICDGRTSQVCSASQYWDFETCRCKCRETPAGCCSPKQWSKTSCSCQCPNRVVCPSNMVWDENLCRCRCTNVGVCKLPYIWLTDKCVCGCPNVKCMENQVLDPTTCKCRCNTELSSQCVAGIHTWNNDRCRCECVDTENTPSCVTGTILDPDTCTDCIYPQLYACTSPQTWNKQKGFCSCAEESSCEIAGDNGRHRFNSRTCQCECSPNEAQLNCGVNTEFDYASCSCVCNVLTLDCPAGQTFDPVVCACTSTPSSFLEALKQLSLN